MTHNVLSSKVTVGLDLGDTASRVYAVDAAGECLAEATVATTPAALAQYFSTERGWRVVLEVGTHSPWVSRQLEQLGHEVIVANPSAVYGTRRRRKRNDRLDAEFWRGKGAPIRACCTRSGIGVRRPRSIWSCCEAGIRSCARARR